MYTLGLTNRPRLMMQRVDIVPATWESRFASMIWAGFPVPTMPAASGHGTGR